MRSVYAQGEVRFPLGRADLSPHEFALDHAGLVLRAGHWLRNTQSCGVVLTEPGAGHSGESPDAIGWKSWGYSILIEAKTSRSDFKIDAKKPHRQPGQGMGQERWYLTPPKLIKPGELPPGWGLLEAHTASIRKIVKAEHRSHVEMPVCFREMCLLISALWKEQHPEMLRR